MAQRDSFERIKIAPTGTRFSPIKMDDSPEAPTYEVPDQEFVALEHPMIIRNLDNAIKTFGNNRPFIRVLESADPEQCVPLYLRYRDPMCTPILSHNSPSNNILLKITVPKRTGRKRKRGSNAAFTEFSEASRKGSDAMEVEGNESNNIRSQKGMDRPSTILRRMVDNIDNHEVDVVAEIRQTHRYRGQADFHHSTAHSEFVPRFIDQVMSGDLEKLKGFHFDPSRGWKPNEEFVPAPKMTVHTIPQNWGWHQNSNIHREIEAKTGQDILVNRSKPKRFEVPYLRFDVDEVPQESPFEIPDDTNMQEFIAELKLVFDERPIWSRRSLVNHLAKSPLLYLIRAALQHIGYQFKGGPFRECVIRYGLDPRKDSSYRKYQTVFFKIYEDQRNTGMQWHDLRTTYGITKNGMMKGPKDGHLFDGKKVTLDGKVWHLCDITDPLLATLIDNSPTAKVFDLQADGWFMNGSMAKIRSIMRVKIMAIWRKKQILDDEFGPALAIPDEIPGKKSSTIQVPLPFSGMTAEEFAELNQKGMPNVVIENGVRKRIHKGKMRAHRLHSRTGGVKDTTPSGRKPKGAKSIPTTTKTEIHSAKAGEPLMNDSEAHDATIAEGDHQEDGGDGEMMDRSDQEEESADEDGSDQVSETDEDIGGEEDDEDRLANLPAPVLKRSSNSATGISSNTATSSRAASVTFKPPPSKPVKAKRSRGSATSTPATSKRAYKRRAKNASSGTGSGTASMTASINEDRHTPTPINLSMYQNIAPRPPPA